MKKYILLFLTFTATLNIYSQITTNEQPISLSLRSIDHGLEESVAQNQINFQMEETGKSQFSALPIEVVNSETGRSVYSGILYDGLSISTIGWKPGIYIIVYNDSEKKVTQKITVK